MSLETFESDLFYTSATDETRRPLPIIPTVFESLREYISCLLRPLIEEAKEDLLQAFKSSLCQNSIFRFKLNRRWSEHSEIFLELLLPKSPMKITQGTVVLLSPEKPGRDMRVWPHFASTVTYWQDDSIKLIAKVIIPSDETPYGVSCALGGAIESAYLWAVPTCKISSHLRCRDALLAIHSTQNEFHQFLIQPALIAPVELSKMKVSEAHSSGLQLLECFKDNLNVPQLTAISNCIARVLHPIDENPISRSPFSLIHGPPGTGKTKVIVSLVNILHFIQFQEYFELLKDTIECDKLNMRDVKLKKRKRERMAVTNTHVLKPRFLICAPSNAAVDNLLERIISTGFLQKDGSRYMPDIVRLVGTDAGVSHSAESISVERRVQSLLAMSLNEWNAWYSRQYHTVTSAEAQLKTLLTSNASVEDDCAWVSEVMHIYETRDRALGDLARLERLRSYHLETRSRKVHLACSDLSDELCASFVDEAEIVCSTLSSVSKRYVQTASRPFKAIIVDEACQANEITTLIPLSTSQSHCVLVGDPKQLPATVKSRAAQAAKFNRSLFERLMDAGLTSDLLSIQFRMHPEIAMFPSFKFYRSALVDAEGLIHSRELPSHSHWPFKPYMIFDAYNGREERASNLSCYNVTEARLIIRLLQKYSHYCDSNRNETANIVILSGYREQCLVIEDLLQQSEIPLRTRVSTVDAFQGQESDIIILSCVRTSSEDIGFLADVRRLNVALTRARCSMWIICKCDAVAKFDFWSSLLLDAKKRGRYAKDPIDDIKTHNFSRPLS